MSGISNSLHHQQSLRQEFSHRANMGSIGDMPDARPRFVYALAQQFLSPQIKRKGLLGRKVVPFGPLLSVGGFLFETGAMLGHAFRDRLDAFVVPFSAQEDGPDAADFLRSQGASVARALQSATTINELFMMHEMLVAEPRRPSNEWAQWLVAHGE